MRSGLLKYVIVFTKPVSKETDFSGRVTEHKPAFRTRANVFHNRGNKAIESGEIFTSYTVTFEVRDFHKVTPDMEILYNGYRYRILDINPEQAKQKISIIAEIINE